MGENRERGPFGYDAVPYRGRPVPWATPAALALTSRAHGGPALDPTQRTRVLELGCGDGAHLLSLAWFRPHVAAVGIDASAPAIARAREAARALGLTNVRFELADLAAYAPAAPDERFDVVLAHGVYSWIDADARASLRRLTARALVDGGLAYVSFNAEPGWSVRGLVRAALLRARPRGLTEARATLDGLAALAGAVGDGPWPALFARELARAAHAEDGYLAHEYLAPVNEAFWLEDVARAFADEGLAYVGDATFDRAEGFVDPELAAAAARLGGGAGAADAWIDLVAFRQLRAAVLAKTGAVGAPPRPALLVADAWIASALARRSDPFDAREGVEETFDGALGREVRVRSATTKIALLLLASRYPEALRLEALHAECAARLAPLGLAADPPARLAEALGALYTEMQVELRLEPARLGVAVPERPRALDLTRLEARERDVLSTPTGGMLPLGPLERALVDHLDGSRDFAQLVAALAGDPVSAEGSLDARIAEALASLARWGLLA
ncbi:MAG: methyltransferase domain-containing protein [Sandaracinaceae bacterium]|nr:methyltransferase domain-containing protein [Sandaracinaceae bacterium]